MTAGQRSQRNLRRFVVMAGICSLVGLSVFMTGKRYWSGATASVMLTGPFVQREEIPIRTDNESLVELKQLVITPRKQHVEVIVSFSFEGTVDASRQMEVCVSLFDSQDVMIGSNSRICADSRLLAKKRHPMATFRRAVGNNAYISVPAIGMKIEDIASIELTFSEA